MNALPIRLIREIPPRLLWRFLIGAGLGNLRAINRFERRRRQGVYFPPFIFTSVTQRCNLSCKGCWATGVQEPVDMSPELLHAIVTESRAQGCRFFGILGGEPLLLPWLPDFFERHRDAYFQLFTNGQLLDGRVAARLRRTGNVSPLISVEGGADAYADRRGDGLAYGRALDALARCREQGLVTGVATSVSASTYADVVSDRFVDDMAARGAHYLWYYIFRPSGPVPSFDEALNDGQVRTLRRFLLEQRTRCKNVAIIDAYWDHDGNSLCPAATGISHHINARGEVEPCPPIQCADCRVEPGQVAARIAGSPLLTSFRAEVPHLTRGCVLMDHPRELTELAARCGARDSSGRETFYRDLAKRPALRCHDHGGEALPERAWAYRFAKKHWFFGFGAYG